ncbi:MAG: DUF423 domain-containing protein [Rhodospirillaceae bacterium]
MTSSSSPLRTAGAALGILAGALGLLAVVVGALGAHAGLPTASSAWIETGLKYHLPHLAVAWAAVIAAPAAPPAARRDLLLAAALWSAGILAFAGGLYVQALSDLRPGIIVPAGAFGLIGGWIFAALAAVRLSRGAAA